MIMVLHTTLAACIREHLLLLEIGRCVCLIATKMSRCLQFCWASSSTHHTYGMAGTECVRIGPSAVGLYVRIISDGRRSKTTSAVASSCEFNAPCNVFAPQKTVGAFFITLLLRALAERAWRSGCLSENVFLRELWWRSWRVP